MKYIFGITMKIYGVKPDKYCADKSNSLLAMFLVFLCPIQYS